MIFIQELMHARTRVRREDRDRPPISRKNLVCSMSIWPTLLVIFVSAEANSTTGFGSTGSISTVGRGLRRGLAGAASSTPAAHWLSPAVAGI